MRGLLIRLRFWFSLLLATLTAVSAHADQAAIESSLRTEFVDKIVILRGFYEGSKLRFGRDGNPIGKATRGYWSSDGMIKVSDIERESDGALRVTGRRIVNVFDSSLGRFQNVLSKEVVVLDLEVDSWDDVSKLRGALLKVVATDLGELKTMVPDYWNCWVSGTPIRNSRGEWTCRLAGGAKGDIVRGESNDANPSAPPIRKGVAAPQPTSTPDPEYTKLGRKMRVRGMSVLWVKLNEKGEASDIMVMRPLGGGLDDKAVEAVRKWRFEPARKEGQPVQVQINIEVNFRP
jgi:TonB family protein